MRSIHDIVKAINEAIPIEGASLFGIAQPANRDGQIIPADMATNQYVGIDDTFPVRVYHKNNAMTSTLRQGSGFGDGTGDQVNVYQMSMIVFNNRRLTKIQPDSLVLLMQVNTPRSVESEYFKSIRITYVNANLNSSQIWSQEYGTTLYRLGLEQDLIQINYTVEATFRQGCFAKCLDELCNN